MNLLTCGVCGSVVRPDEVRGFCVVCGRRTCVVCMRVCEVCGGVVCQDCVRCRVVYRDGRMFLVWVCDRCWERGVWV